MASSLHQPSAILGLPDELLLSILRCARAGTPLPNFIDILLACKRFHAIGKPAALEMLHITNNNFDAWVHSTKYIGAQYSNVKYLTVDLSSNEPRNTSNYPCREIDVHCGQQCIGKHLTDDTEYVDRIAIRLKELARVLRTDLRSLVTFALTIDFEPTSGIWCGCCTSPVPCESIAKVLDSLPLTCESLLLDTRGSEASHEYQDTPEAHVCQLCTAIVSRMKSLKHVWLRTKSLCRWFMIPEHEKLPDRFALVPPYRSWFDLEWFFTEEYRMSDQMDYSIYYHDGQSMAMGWKAWNKVDGDTRWKYVALAMDNQARIERPPGCLSFPYLESLTINLAVFPAPHFQVSNDSERRARAIMIARDQWGCFPALRDCSVVAPHLEDLDKRELKTLLNGNHNVMPDPCFEPLSEVFVWDLIRNTTAVLPIRFLTPEGELRMKRIRTQKVYAFHDLAILPKQRYGSFKDFDHIIDLQVSGGWITSATDGMRFPKSLASHILGLDQSDAFAGCLSRKEMEKKILRSKKILPLWIDRAYAAQARKLNGVLDNYQVRDNTTGELRTQRPYEMRKLE